MSRGQVAVDEEVPPPICEWCGLRIDEPGKDCPALPDGGCTP